MKSTATPAKKQPVNVSISSALLKEARRQDINLSAVLEKALALEVRQRRAAQWKATNRAAIKAYNADVIVHGTFSDRLRSF